MKQLQSSCLCLCALLCCFSFSCSYHIPAVYESLVFSFSVFPTRLLCDFHADFTTCKRFVRIARSVSFELACYTLLLASFVHLGSFPVELATAKCMAEIPQIEVEYRKLDTTCIATELLYSILHWSPTLQQIGVVHRYNMWTEGEER